jgi:hypothetical protein
MKKIGAALLIVITLLVAFKAVRWIVRQPTQPTQLTASTGPKDHASPHLPEKNKKILALVEARGKEIAPHYHDVVCTEFVIKVINEFDPLTKKEKKDIRIITDDNLNDLIDREAPVIKGVQTALINGGKGIIVDDPTKVLPGDFVQFWDTIYGIAYGHCGIVSEIDPLKSLTLHSSHPFTGGYGIQKFPWPQKVFFVRLE